MQNYPLTVNFYICVLYLIVYFSYIIPTVLWGSAISQEERTAPMSVFATIGCTALHEVFFGGVSHSFKVLDAISSIMQSFAFNYITSGALLILLMQVLWQFLFLNLKVLSVP